MSSQEDLLRQFILSNLKYLTEESGTGKDVSLPHFKLYPRDYIEFVEKEIGSRDTRSLINCIAHLKRAVDCQLDSFFHVLGLAKIFDKRNLKFDKKLEFLEASGVFSARTLSRLNAIRNRMEHAYEVPKVRDLEAYFDLVVAFVSVMERTILMFSQYEINYHIFRGDGEYVDSYGIKVSKYWFNIAYHSAVPRISTKWKIQGEERDLVADTNDIQEFAYFLRVFILLSQRQAFASDKYIIAQLQ